MKKNRLFSAALLFLFLLSACNLPTAQEILDEARPVDLNAVLTQAAPDPEGAEVIPTEEPLPTEAPKEVLTVCLGKEPQTLFFYNEASQAMWSVLESIYDGPFDHINGESVPVIFESVQVETESVPVAKDTIILDGDGQITAINYGISITPSNPMDVCGYQPCAFNWNSNRTDVEMNRAVVTFKLRSGLTWSDGTPLTAEDSVYSFSVNGMRDIKASKTQLNLTDSYTAADERTVVWKGIPGYSVTDPSDVFWVPLPKHSMTGLTAEDLLKSEAVNRSPLGWGAYRIARWDAGEQITAERNPNYLPADGEPPFFDEVVFKFLGNAGNNNLEAMRNGTCDLIDTSVDLSPDLEPILEDVRDGKSAIYVQPQLTWQQITFGISSLQENRSSVTTGGMFLEKSVRQAFAQCIDREALNRQVLYGQSEIPVDFYPKAYQSHDSALNTPIAYDPAAGLQVLLDNGWADDDGNPITPLVSERVPYVNYGTPFTVRLDVPDSPNGKKAAEMIRENLAQCGIQAEVAELPLGKLYAQGPEGVLFGRKFDLAMFSWGTDGSDPCGLYSSEEIPTEENRWIGTNVGGYSSRDYDSVCKNGPNGELTMTAAQMYADEMPAIPLYFNISIAASRLDLCGVENTMDSRSILWNIETLSRSENGTCAVSQWKNIYQ